MRQYVWVRVAAGVVMSSIWIGCAQSEDLGRRPPGSGGDVGAGGTVAAGGTTTSGGSGGGTGSGGTASGGTGGSTASGGTGGLGVGGFGALGSISWEKWYSSGNTIANIPLQTPPAETGTYPSFEAPADVGDDYGLRVRGYLHPETTGAYTFWIAGDDETRLSLSTDASPSNATIIANSSSYTGLREWNKHSSQKSAPINLVAGQAYYIEALMKEGGGGDSLSVGWAEPGEGTTEPSEVIPGTVLSTF